MNDWIILTRERGAIVAPAHARLSTGHGGRH